MKDRMARPRTKSEAATAKRFLRQQRDRALTQVRTASLLSVLGGVLVIASAWLLARMVHAGIFDHATRADLSQAGLIFLAVYALRALLLSLAEYQGNRAAQAVKSSLREELVARMLDPESARDTAAQTGSRVTVLMEGLDALHGYYARYLPSMTASSVIPIAILCFVVPVDWISAVVLLVTGPLIPVFMILIGEGAERLNQKQWRTLAHLNGYCFDRIQGLTTLKLFGASRREGEAIARMGEQYRQETMAILRTAFLSSLALEFFSTISIALVAVFIGFRLLWGHASFDHAYLVLLLAPEFFLPLRRLGTNYHARMEAIGAVEDLMPLLTETPTTQRCEAAPSQPCSIRFEGVSGSYAPGKFAVKELSFYLPAGQHLALIGPSGSGKSTLLHMLLGLMPHQGTIWIDDTRLADIDRAQWWRMLGWVPQTAHLFWGTVAENIRLGDPDMDPAAFDRLVSALGIDFLQQQVGEQASGLSGGQAQRVAVARALARRAPLLLMDEPTASLDAASEQKIQSAITHYAEGSTRITAAHRLHTVAHCQHVLLLQQGGTAAFGTPSELAGHSPLYRDTIAQLEAC